MRIETQDYNEVTVITLQGELDNDSMEMLKNEVTQTVSKSSSGIVLDMSSISFIDSQGLEQLLWTRDYCNENRCVMRTDASLDWPVLMRIAQRYWKLHDLKKNSIITQSLAKQLKVSHKPNS
ncbi:MAG: STAS domain-containing protein [Planctomycetota bacterium]|jgi:anti-anti-sigma factor